MKKSTIITALFLWSVSFAVLGQGIASLGAKAGISLANQRYRITPIDYTLETDPVAGPALTIFLEAFQGNHFSFQGDLSYALKGSRSGTRSVTVNHLDQDRILVNEGEVTKSTFHYLSFSPLARYRFERGSLVPGFFLGPRMDILLKYHSASEFPLTDQNSLILGLTCGAGLEYRIRQMGFFTELQYLPDISPVTGREPLWIRNHMVSLTWGIRWIASE